MEYPYEFHDATPELGKAVLGLFWALGWVDVLFVGYIASQTTQWGASSEQWAYVYPGIALAIVAIAGLWAFGKAVFWPSWLGKCAAVPRQVLLAAFIVALTNWLLLIVPLLFIALWHRSLDASVYPSVAVQMVLSAIATGVMFVLWRRQVAHDS